LLPPLGAPPEPEDDDPEDDPEDVEVAEVDELPDDELSPPLDSFFAAVPFEDAPDDEPARLSVR